MGRRGNLVETTGKKFISDTRPLSHEEQSSVLALYDNIVKTKAELYADETVKKLYKRFDQARHAFSDYVNALKEKLGIDPTQLWDLKDDGSGFERIATAPEYIQEYTFTAASARHHRLDRTLRVNRD
jgi:phosphopantothenate synthetase